MPKSFQLTAASSARSIVNPVKDGTLMYMPAGVHQITPSQNGRPVTVCVDVTPDAADVLEQQRKSLTAQGKKPFFSPAHKEVMAAFWPSRFYWDKKLDATGSLAEGVWADGTWTKTGEELVEGKEFRTFSPTFFVDALRNDPDNPVHVICCEDAKANMGALENDPAFQQMSPLWAHNAKLSAPRGAKNAGVPGNNQRNSMTEQEKLIAELQARNEKLELTCNALAQKDDAIAKAELKAARAEIAQNKAEMALAEEKKNTESMQTERKAQLEASAASGVQAMVKSGKIPARDREMQDFWKDKFIKDPSLISAMTGGELTASGSMVPPRTITPPAASLDASGNQRFQSGWDFDGVFKRYAELVCANANMDWRDPENRLDTYRRKGKLALEAGVFYNTELKPNLDRWQHSPITEIGKAIGLKAGNARPTGPYQLQAADYTDNNAPSNVLGVLSGTLVLQRTLPFFAYKYPELMNFYTDFSDTPGLLNQTETTRIVVQQAVQSYSAATDGTGRPKGWGTVVSAQTVDVSLTLTDYVAVPIVFGQNVLGATTRRLFDEQSVLAIKSLANYFVGMLTNLATSGTYNAYSQVTNAPGGNNIPNGIPLGGTVYPTYAKGLPDFSMSDVDNLDTIFTNGRVPEEDRGIMLTPSYYAKLRGDPRLSFYYAASAKDAGAGAGEFLSEARLPKLSGFSPYKAPYLPSTTPGLAGTNMTNLGANTPNVVGFAFQKAAAVVKSRLPQDFTQALGVMIPGSVTTITDPDTKISIMLVQYVSLQGGWAEWRPEVILGVAPGDTRAGLVMTSQ